MNKAKGKRTTGISGARTVEEIADFWDSHSLADYWDKTGEASFEVRATRRRRVTIDPEVYAQIEALAHLRGILPETLVNLWLVEQLRQNQKAQQSVTTGLG